MREGERGEGGREGGREVREGGEGGREGGREVREEWRAGREGGKNGGRKGGKVSNKYNRILASVIRLSEAMSTTVKPLSPNLIADLHKASTNKEAKWLSFMIKCTDLPLVIRQPPSNGRNLSYNTTATILCNLQSLDLLSSR